MDIILGGAKTIPERKVGAVLIVGGGIGGMQAALDLADANFKVYVVEKEPAIGGVMAKLDKTFPTNDCAMCIMAPKLVATGKHHNITIISNAEVDKIGGRAGNFLVTIKKKARYVREDKCTGCGQCAQYCPVTTLDEYNENMQTRKAIYVKYAQAIPLVYRIDRDACIGCGTCESICLAGAIEYSQELDTIDLDIGSIILAPGFSQFDARSKPEYGYGRYRNVVLSSEFERMLSATGPYRGLVLRPSDGEIPRKIAWIQCVGSRDAAIGTNFCSSVCCMYAIKEAIIAKEHVEGIEAKIFFMDARVHGKEFEYYYNRGASEYGLKYVKNRVSDVFEDPETQNLIIKYAGDNGPVKEEFEMVVLSVGMRPPTGIEDLCKRLDVDLNEYKFCKTGTFTPLETSHPGIFVCGPFSSPKDIPETVAQGSGAAAKAANVIASERGQLVSVPEMPPEVDVTGQTPRIGVFVCHCGINIGGTVRVPEVVEYAKSLPNVTYAEHNLYTCSKDTQEQIKRKIKEHDLNRVIVASCTPRTHEPLFRNTCRESGLNPYLFEMANIRDQCSWIHMHEPGKATEKAKDLVRMAVAKSRRLEALQKGFLTVNQSAIVIGGGIAGMTAALDLAEQGFPVHLIERKDVLGGNLRRLHGLLGGEDPKTKLAGVIKRVKAEEKIILHLNTKVKHIEGFVGNFACTLLASGKESVLNVGAVIVATGAEESRPREYLYGKDPRVVTQLELEEKLARGEVSPETVVIIQCVGSRSTKEGERGYCSRICCAHAMRSVLAIKERNPKADVYVLYRDIRTYGFKEDIYRQARAAGAIFAKYSEDRKPEVVLDGKDLKVTVYEEILDRSIAIKPDLLVLSAAIVPQEDNEDLAQMLKVPLTKDEFFLEAHMKLRPVDFATDGVFLCGAAHSPKTVEESITQASAAVARAVTILSKEKLETEGIISSVNTEMCNGCGVCVPVCEYGAISLVDAPGSPGRLVAQINEALCKGCGSCSCACPSGAMEQKGFRSDQLFAMIDQCLLE